MLAPTALTRARIRAPRVRPRGRTSLCDYCYASLAKTLIRSEQCQNNSLPLPGSLPVPVELIERRIYLIRGQKVMLSHDLADLYQVPTKRLNEAVRRNLTRFPEDFMFQLTSEEAAALRSQIATLEKRAGRGRYSKYAPLAFTEHGVAMLSSVLNSDRAVQMNIIIVRAFIKLREVLASNKELARRIEAVETKLRQHGAAISVVVDEIKTLKAPPRRRKARIGFYTDQ